MPEHLSLRMTLAKVNLRLAHQWTHTSPSMKQARIEELHREVDSILSEAGY